PPGGRGRAGAARRAGTAPPRGRSARSPAPAAATSTGTRRRAQSPARPPSCRRGGRSARGSTGWGPRRRAPTGSRGRATAPRPPSPRGPATIRAAGAPGAARSRRPSPRGRFQWSPRGAAYAPPSRIPMGVRNRTAPPVQAGGMDFDVLIRGGDVVDGTGAPRTALDVGIAGDRLAAVDRLAGAGAARVIDAGGLVVAPGFID